MARRRRSTPARRRRSNPGTSKSKGRADSALASARRMRKKSKALENGALGFGAGHLASGYYGDWFAKRAFEGKSLMIPKTNISYGKGGGAGLFAVGLLGMAGDERTNTVAMVAGAQVYGADRGINRYLVTSAELAAKAAAGGGTPA